MSIYKYQRLTIEALDMASLIRSLGPLKFLLGMVFYNVSVLLVHYDSLSQ